MNLTIIHKERTKPDNGYEQFRSALCSELAGGIILSDFNSNFCRKRNNDIIALPEDWTVGSGRIKQDLIYYKDALRLPAEALSSKDPWLCISNGRFTSQTDRSRLKEISARSKADIVSFNVLPELVRSSERTLTTSQGNLIGLRRIYNDIVQPSEVPCDWPHYVFIKTDILSRITECNALGGSFSDFKHKCGLNSLSLLSFNIGGEVCDLQTEDGLLQLILAGVSSSAKDRFISKYTYPQVMLVDKSIRISAGARILGRVLLADNIDIGENAIISGPAVIGSNVKIGRGAVVRASVICQGVSIPSNNIVSKRVLLVVQTAQNTNNQSKTVLEKVNNVTRECSLQRCSFRTWPRFSYPMRFKRIFDIIFAAAVLFFFAPFFPIISLAIKLTSRGPVFYKSKRQGYHGKDFYCLKFRTMEIGSEEIQTILRVINNVDGPQFKLKNDPRINAVGRFLRDTHIDEVPQFINVLFGQMSVVGPRPSPESENVLCPYWRDARLSVRPGITGLWQACNTREPMRDFQEWIYYDTRYVKKISLSLDMWICWATLKRVSRTFVKQF